MNDKVEVWEGAAALTAGGPLERGGSLLGRGIARQIERTSADLSSVNRGTVPPALVKFEPAGNFVSECGIAASDRKAKYYQLARAGQKKNQQETQEWESLTGIVASVLNPREGMA